jgi:predicted 3-demethylubiquinone-9 3-methyltransferase (glyoxalase superfamily)
MQSFVTHLWFDDQAEQAAKFYTSIFPNSRIVHVARYGAAGAEASGRPLGSVMTVEFELDGQQFIALNGGPIFKFNESISLLVNCRDQAEIDQLWHRLLEGGQPNQCGWLKDRYGLSWQIVPAALRDMMADKDEHKVERVMRAILKMVKIDLAELQRVYAQR